MNYFTCILYLIPPRIGILNTLNISDVSCLALFAWFALSTGGAILFYHHLQVLFHPFSILLGLNFPKKLRFCCASTNSCVVTHFVRRRFVNKSYAEMCLVSGFCSSWIFHATKISIEWLAHFFSWLVAMRTTLYMPNYPAMHTNCEWLLDIMYKNMYTKSVLQRRIVYILFRRPI